LRPYFVIPDLAYGTLILLVVLVKFLKDVWVKELLFRAFGVAGVQPPHVKIPRVGHYNLPDLMKLRILSEIRISLLELSD
jgi:hypothetical protein